MMSERGDRGAREDDEWVRARAVHFQTDDDGRIVFPSALCSSTNWRIQMGGRGRGRARTGAGEAEGQTELREEAIMRPEGNN